MSFLNLSPWQAFALVAGTLAAIVGLYLLKPSPKKIIVSSTLLWSRVVKERRRRSDRLRWWLSLLLAATIGILLALALGRPELGASLEGREKVTILVDNALTMATRTSDGRSRWDMALLHARSLIVNASPAQRFKIIDTAGQIETPTFEERQEALRTLGRLHLSTTRPIELSDVDEEETELSVISDGVHIDPDTLPSFARFVPTFEPADNVGITRFELEALPAHPSRYEAYVELANDSADAKEASLVLSGGGGKRLERTVTIESGETRGEIFDLAELDAGPIRVSVTAPGDSLDVDNLAFSYLPRHGLTRITLVSEGNLYLETFLESDPRYRWTRVAPEEFRETPATDVYIFDRFAPETRPNRPSFLIAPPPTSWLPSGSGEVERPEVVEWDLEHPVLRSVSLEDLDLDHATELDSGNVGTLVRSSSGALMLVGDEPVRWLLLAFDLDTTTFPIQPSFPVFLSNALNWLGSSAEVIRRSPGKVSVPGTGVTIRKLDGEVVPTWEVGSRTLFNAPGPGIFVLEEGKHRFYVLVSAAEREVSFPNQSRLSDTATTGVDEPASVHGPRLEKLWIVLLAIAALLLILEGWTYHRRWTI
jgi:hypothetical protein